MDLEKDRKNLNERMAYLAGYKASLLKREYRKKRNLKWWQFYARFKVNINISAIEND